MRNRRLTAVYLTLALCSVPAVAITPWQAQDLSQAVAKGSWKQSETIFRELLETSPGDAEDALTLKYNLGLSLLHQGQHEEAKGLFETVVKESPDKGLRAKASYNLGNTLFALQKLDDARKAFEQSLLIDSDDDDARYNIEVILRKQEQDQQKKDQEKKDEQEQDQEDKQDQGEQGKNPSQDQQSGEGDPKDGEQGKDGEQQDGQEQDGGQKENSQSKPADGGQPERAKDGQGKDGAAAMTAAEKKAAQEAQERARLLEFFRQQERDGRPAMQVQQQAPPPGGKTW